MRLRQGSSSNRRVLFHESSLWSAQVRALDDRAFLTERAYALSSFALTCAFLILSRRRRLLQALEQVTALPLRARPLREAPPLLQRPRRPRLWVSVWLIISVSMSISISISIVLNIIASSICTFGQTTGGLRARDPPRAGLGTCRCRAIQPPARPLPLEGANLSWNQGGEPPEGLDTLGSSPLGSYHVDWPWWCHGRPS